MSSGLYIDPLYIKKAECVLLGDFQNLYVQNHAALED